MFVSEEACVYVETMAIREPNTSVYGRGSLTHLFLAGYGDVQQVETEEQSMILLLEKFVIWCVHAPIALLTMLTLRY